MENISDSHMPSQFAWVWPARPQKAD